MVQETKYYLIINQYGQPLFGEKSKRAWLFISPEAAVEFLKSRKEIDKDKIRTIIGVYLTQVSNQER